MCVNSILYIKMSYLALTFSVVYNMRKFIYTIYLSNFCFCHKSVHFLLRFVNKERNTESSKGKSLNFN